VALVLSMSFIGLIGGLLLQIREFLLVNRQLDRVVLKVSRMLKLFAENRAGGFEVLREMQRWQILRVRVSD